MIQSINANIAMPYTWAIIFFIIFLSPKLVVAKEVKFHKTRLNVIDRSWRRDPDWRNNRQHLAECSVGFAGKMANNMGSLEDLTYYEVTDPSDNAVDPKPSTLRYGATLIRGKLWITFLKDMIIELEQPLLISSFTTIDGQGARVHIAGNACLTIFEVSYFSDCCADFIYRRAMLFIMIVIAIFMKSRTNKTCQISLLKSRQQCYLDWIRLYLVLHAITISCY